jgi:hypothetical protein
VLEARQEVAVMEAAAAVLEEKLAASALEAAAALEARQRAEEKTAALTQETQWLQARVKSLQARTHGRAHTHTHSHTHTATRTRRARRGGRWQAPPLRAAPRTKKPSLFRPLGPNHTHTPRTL